MTIQTTDPNIIHDYVSFSSVSISRSFKTPMATLSLYQQLSNVVSSIINMAVMFASAIKTFFKVDPGLSQSVSNIPDDTPQLWTPLDSFSRKKCFQSIPAVPMYMSQDDSIPCLSNVHQMMLPSFQEGIKAMQRELELLNSPLSNQLMELAQKLDRVQRFETRPILKEISILCDSMLDLSNGHCHNDICDSLASMCVYFKEMYSIMDKIEGVCGSQYAVAEMQSHKESLELALLQKPEIDTSKTHIRLLDTVARVSKASLLEYIDHAIPFTIAKKRWYAATARHYISGSPNDQKVSATYQKYLQQHAPQLYALLFKANQDFSMSVVINKHVTRIQTATPENHIVHLSNLIVLECLNRSDTPENIPPADLKQKIEQQIIDRFITALNASTLDESEESLSEMKQFAHTFKLNDAEFTEAFAASLSRETTLIPSVAKHIPNIDDIDAYTYEQI